MNDLSVGMAESIMLTALLLVLATPQKLAASRIDLADRVKRLDAAWMLNKTPQRREGAVSEISGAVMAFFSGRTGEACQALDRATAALEGRQPTGLDALIFRQVPPIASPGSKVKLVVAWAYPAGATSINVAGKSYSVGEAGGTEITIQTNAKEGTQTLSIQEGARQRTVDVQTVKDFQTRVSTLRTSERAAEIAVALDAMAAGTYETEAPAADWLAKGESIARSGWNAVEEIPAAKHEGVVFRAKIPKAARPDAPVVIALHGAGGSENMFFESYGAGAAPAEAAKRGWVFMSPRSTPGAVPACLAWLREERGIKPRKVFVMGHSMGGGLALSSGTLAAKPDALALFAPASGGSLPAELATTPVFLAVGKQEIMMLRTTATRLGAELSKRADCVFKEYDRCEHLMIVADAVTDAFTFFDKVSR
jgi:predicted esterase